MSCDCLTRCLAHECYGDVAFRVRLPKRNGKKCRPAKEVAACDQPEHLGEAVLKMGLSALADGEVRVWFVGKKPTPSGGAT